MLEMSSFSWSHFQLQNIKKITPTNTKNKENSLAITPQAMAPSCHARMHGLIHDGRLWACQSCLLGLMYALRLLYAIRCFRVMACLGF